MKMRNFLKSLMAVILASVLVSPLIPAVEVQAQTLPLPATVDPAFGSIAADDTDVAMLIRYIGTATSNSGTVEVTVTTSDLTFLQGAQGSEAASTEFECPVSGALGGIIDVSNAACNTVGEVCDVINASTSWRCVALDALRSDVVDARLLTKSATRATTTDGVQINWDTSTAFDATIAVVPPHLRKMSGYIAQGSRTLKFDPFSDSRTIAYQGSALSTYGSGTSTIRFYSVDITQPRANTWTEAVEQIHFQPGGATTAVQTFDFRDVGLPSYRGQKMILRLDNSAAMSVVTLRVQGVYQRSQPGT
jgi:hypothetical protein